MLALIVALVVATPPGEAAAKMFRNRRPRERIASPALDGLQHGLRDLGYLEVATSSSSTWAGTRSERFDSLAADLVRGKPDFIITWGTPAALAAKKATATIPIVMGAIGDPVSVGVVTSLARPGGNITGLSSLAIELKPSGSELLKGARSADLTGGGPPGIRTTRRCRYPRRPRAQRPRRLGLKLSFVSVTEAPTLEAVLDLVGRQRPDGLLVMAEPSLIAQGGQIAAFASKSRLPAVYPYLEHAQAGGL